MRLLLAFVLSGVALSAQEKLAPFPRTDPYTKNAPEKIHAAGYVSLGPFRFGDDHTTAQVESTLAGVPLVWVESEHFRIGSGLPECEAGDERGEKERLKGELEALATRLPDVKTRVRKLDPWLRLHLVAQRLETLYADFQRLGGFRASEFPALGSEGGDGSMGAGPYLGMKGKFCVLVFASKAHLRRYSAAYLRTPSETPVTVRFEASDAWLFATARDLLPAGYESDTALACDLLGHVAQSLALGLRGGHGELPFAVRQGLAHVFARRFDARYPLFEGPDPARFAGQPEDWTSEVRTRVEHRVFPSSADLLAWSDPERLEWADHLVLWSRFDYLLRREDGAGGQFLRRLQEPLAADASREPEVRAERARAALVAAAGVPLASLDEAWATWVQAHYGAAQR